MTNPTSTYVRQRVTAIILIPFGIWFAFIVCKSFLNMNSDITILLSPVLNKVLFFLFSSFALYHGYLGLITIFDDYIHCKIVNKLLKISLFLFSVITFTTLFVIVMNKIP